MSYEDKITFWRDVFLASMKANPADQVADHAERADTALATMERRERNGCFG